MVLQNKHGYFQIDEGNRTKRMRINDERQVMIKFFPDFTQEDYALIVCALRQKQARCGRR